MSTPRNYRRRTNIVKIKIKEFWSVISNTRNCLNNERARTIEKFYASRARGVHPPETMMHFPLFQIPPIFEKISDFRTLRNIFTILTFPDKFLDFHPSKFLMTFFFWSSTTNFEFSPYFPCFNTFPPCFAKIIIPPTLINFPPVLDKFTCFLHTSRVFRFPPTLTMMHLCITQCTYWTPLFPWHKYDNN